MPRNSRISRNSKNPRLAGKSKNYYAVAIAANAIIGNSKAIKRVKKRCPKDLRKEIFAAAIVICARKGNKKALHLVKDICANTDDLQISVFSRAIKDCAIMNCPIIVIKKALNLVKDACSDKDNLKIKIFSQAMLLLAVKDNERFDKVNDVCPDNLKIAIFARTMVLCAQFGNKKAVNVVNDACPDDLKEEMLSQVKFICNKAKKKEVWEMIEAATNQEFTMDVPMNKVQRSTNNPNSNKRKSLSRNSDNLADKPSKKRIKHV